MSAVSHVAVGVNFYAATSGGNPSPIPDDLVSWLEKWCDVAELSAVAEAHRGPDGVFAAQARQLDGRLPLTAHGPLDPNRISHVDELDLSVPVVVHADVIAAWPDWDWARLGSRLLVENLDAPRDPDDRVFCEVMGSLPEARVCLDVSHIANWSSDDEARSHIAVMMSRFDVAEVHVGCTRGMEDSYGPVAAPPRFQLKTAAQVGAALGVPVIYEGNFTIDTAEEVLSQLRSLA